jgi:hypothetical protein
MLTKSPGRHIDKIYYIYRVNLHLLKNYWILLIAVLGLFSACESSFEYQTNSLSKLTIISQVAPTGWTDEQRVYVYTSQSPADSSSFFTPDDLVVSVTEVESSLTIELQPTNDAGKTYFKIPDGFLKAGFSYIINAFAPGFEPVQATTTIPRPSTIEELVVKTVRIDQSELNDFKNILRYTLQFKINHYSEANRYYHLVFYNEYVGEPLPAIVNPELSDNQPFIHHYAYGVLIDRHDLVEGKPLVFNFLEWSVKGNDLKKVYVELRSITAEYYKYHSTLARQLIVRQDPFAEPVTIFNNIKGGYGNFSGFTQNVSSSDFPL